MSPNEITQEDYFQLINTIFANTDEGKLLLDIWVEQFMFRKTADHGDDLLSIGLKQGEQGFVLSIVNLLKSFNNEANTTQTEDNL